jgi:hypothetical protein
MVHLTHKLTHTSAHLHTRAFNTHTHTHTHTHTRTRTYTQVHIFAHAHTHAYAHTHTRARTQFMFNATRVEAQAAFALENMVRLPCLSLYLPLCPSFGVISICCVSCITFLLLCVYVHVFTCLPVCMSVRICLYMLCATQTEATKDFALDNPYCFPLWESNIHTDTHDHTNPLGGNFRNNEKQYV